MYAQKGNFLRNFRGRRLQLMGGVRNKRPLQIVQEGKAHFDQNSSRRKTIKIQTKNRRAKTRSVLLAVWSQRKQSSTMTVLPPSWLRKAPERQ